MEYAQKRVSPLLAQILARMQQNQQYQPQSWGALAAGLGASYLDKRSMDKALQQEQAQSAAQKNALVAALSKRPESIQLDTLSGDPVQMQQTRIDPRISQIAGSLPPEVLGQAASAQLAQLLSGAPKKEYLKVGPDETLVDPDTMQPTFTGKGKPDDRKSGTEDIHVGGGLWQTFETRPDGTVDLKKPIGEKFSKRPDAAETNVSLPPQQNAFERGLGEGLAADVVSSKKLADESVEVINTVHEGRRILDSGIISGFGANTIVGIGKALRQAGFDVAEDDIANTEAFAANMAQNVGKIIKQFGAGTGLSDADREYAQKMAGGEIKLEEKSLRKILDINEKASRNLINNHNKKVKGIESVIPLEVQIPAYMGSGPAPDGVDPKVWDVMTPEERALFRP